MTRAQTAPPADSVARNTLFALLVQATSSVFTAITTVFVVRQLGPDDFGVLALAFSICGVVGVLARFGIPASLARYLAENRGDPVVCAHLIRDALRLILLTGLITTGTLFVAAPAIASAFNVDDLVWPLRAMAISLLAETVLTLYLRAFAGLSRVVVNLRIVFLESVAEAAAIITLVGLGAGVVGAALGRAVGYAFGTAVAIAIVVRLYGRVAVAVGQRRRVSGQSRRLIRYALPLVTLDGIFTLYSSIDVLIISRILNTNAVGLFSAPASFIPAFETVGRAVATSVAPRQAKTADGRPRVDAFVAAIRWLLILHAAVIAPLIVWADPITRVVFGVEYTESADVVRLLVPYFFLSGVSVVVSNTVNFLGYAHRRIPIALAALAINAAITVAFLPHIGVTAAAIGTSAALCVYVPAQLEICRRQLGFALGPLLRSTARALLAGAAMAATLALVGGTQTLTVAGAVAGIVGGSVVFVLTLVATREVRPREIRHVANEAAIRWRRLRRR